MFCTMIAYGLLVGSSDIRYIFIIKAAFGMSGCIKGLDRRTCT